MPRKATTSPGELPQRSDTWHLTLRQMDLTGYLEDGSSVQPYIFLLTDPAKERILASELLVQAPDAESVRQLLFKAMTDPDELRRQKAFRPQKVSFEDTALVQQLAPSLEEIGVQAGYADPIEDIDMIIAEIEDSLTSEAPELPGLLSVEGVTPELIGDLFAAAAEFYRAAPWRYLADNQPLAITLSPPGKQGFVQLMGNAGLEFGLVLYWNWDEVLRVYQFDSDPLAHIPESGMRSLSYDSVELAPSADLEAQETHGWEVASEEAFPIPIIYTAETAERPPREELLAYTALLRAIPCFATETLQSDEEGDYLPGKGNFEIETQDGPISVTIEYPAGELPEATDLDLLEIWDEDDEFDEMDLDEGFTDEMLPFVDPSADPDEQDRDGSAGLPFFDRRAMEGHMARLFGGTGGAKADRKLEKAKRLMYRAWEEENPTKRITLANQALDITPDCTDAYVLLAEEQAETVEEAYDLFQKGLQAGERTLGEAFFEENEGDFWGLLETRPYMRARQGLADCLTMMGREQEALEHYRDILRLNPGDNQGIRYSALALLIRLKRDEEAQALLNEYEDDAFAAWPYSQALITYRKEGESPEAETALQEAIQRNPHIPGYLTGRKPLPEELPPYMGFGDESEAMHYALDHFHNWWRTQGAIEWLKRQIEPSKSKSRRRKATRGKRRKKRS